MMFALALTTVLNLAYGPDPAQRFDVYASGAHGATVIVMVHGGGWRIGDKQGDAVVRNKAAHWVPRNYVFTSVNYRLDVPPLVQAHDVAAAVAEIRKRAREWGGDPAKIVLIGHSAGAHLVALLAATHHDILGSILLDSAALDVPRIMEHRHPRLYDEAFGGDPVVWRSASPWHQLTRGTSPILAVCSSRRSDSCEQAHRFADKAVSLGGRASVLEEDLSHREINETVGEPGAYTAAVDRFLATLR
jgi:arylformamidase